VWVQIPPDLLHSNSTLQRKYQFGYFFEIDRKMA